MITVLFFTAALMALIGAGGVVLFRDPIKSVLSLVAVMLALAGLFLLLSAQFIFAVQIIVYAGAVMVLFVFVVALIGPVRESPSAQLRFQGFIGVLVAGSFAGLLVAMLGGIRYQTPAKLDMNTFGGVENIAYGLFTTYLYPFELTSMLLLVAAIGAVYLSRRDR